MFVEIRAESRLDDYVLPWMQELLDRILYTFFGYWVGMYNRSYSVSVSSFSGQRASSSSDAGPLYWSGCIISITNARDAIEKNSCGCLSFNLLKVSATSSILWWLLTLWSPPQTKNRFSPLIQADLRHFRLPLWLCGYCHLLYHGFLVGRLVSQPYFFKWRRVVVPPADVSFMLLRSLFRMFSYISLPHYWKLFSGTW